MLGELCTARGDLTHSLVNTGMVVPFPAPVTHPSRNILNNDEGFAVSKVFAAPLRFQMPLTAESANFACHT